MSGNFGALVILLFPLIGAIVSFLSGKKSKEMRNDTVDIVTFVEVALLAFYAYKVVWAGQIYNFKINGLFGLGFSLRLNAFSIILCAISTILWFVINLYSEELREKMKHASRYYLFYLLAMFCVMGAFLADNLFTLLMFVEFLIFVTYPLLIMDETEKQKKIAKRFWVSGMIGALLTFSGMAFVYISYMKLNVDTLYLVAVEYGSSPMVLVGCLTMVLGLAVSTGCLPVSVWYEMDADEIEPSVLVVYHSVMNKVGFVVIALVCADILVKTTVGPMVIFALGFLTMFVSGVQALFARGLSNSIVAISSTQVGMMMMAAAMMPLCGINNENAAYAVVVLMLSSMITTAGLLMMAGVIRKATDENRLYALHGIGAKNVWLLIAFIVNGLSVAGIPLFSTYAGYTLLRKAMIDYKDYDIFKWIYIVFIGVMLASVIRIFYYVFLPDKGEKHAVKVTMKASTKIALMIPAALTVLLGVVPNIIINWIAQKSVAFFNAHVMEKTFNYYSLDNLKVVLIPIICGAMLAAVMILVEKGQGNRINRKQGKKKEVKMEVESEITNEEFTGEM